MIITLEELEKLKNNGKKIIVGIGTFDLFHYEHLRFLQDAKKLGDIFVVIVKDDFLAKLKLNNRPVICENQRIEIVDNLKCVDYTLMATKSIYEKTKEKITDCNLSDECKDWIYSFYEILKTLKPDILYHENSKNLNPAREYVSKKLNINLISRERTEIISTSKIIDKILNLDK